MKVVKNQVVKKKYAKSNVAQINWLKTPEYREAVLLKILRSMKSYGYSEWMQDELKAIGLSI